MSMNLHCEQMDLWHTPTAITYMCYSNEDGGWEGIKYRYIEWVKGSRNRCYDSEEELKEVNEVVKEHIAKLNSYGDHSHG